MTADYLWDRSGPVDERIADLERVLGTLRFAGTVPAIRTARTVSRRIWPALIAVAAVVTLAAALWFYITPAGVTRNPVSWTIARGSGEYSLEEPTRIKSTGGTETGQWIETKDQASVRLEGLGGGLVHVSPDSRVRVYDLGDQVQRVQLEKGVIHCEPSKSQMPVEVITPSGMATVSPGTACRFTIWKSGGGTAEVKHGRVEFNNGGTITRLNKSVRATFENGGLSTPFVEDQLLPLRIAIFDFDKARWAGDTAAASRFLADILKSATPSDELTLWNLMHRTDEDGRKRIIARARELTKSMWKLDSDALLRLDEGAMEAWWQILESR